MRQLVAGFIIDRGGVKVIYVIEAEGIAKGWPRAIEKSDIFSPSGVSQSITFYHQRNCDHTYKSNEVRPPSKNWGG